jgi:hypothetical protein
MTVTFGFVTPRHWLRCQRVRPGLAGPVRSTISAHWLKTVAVFAAALLCGQASWRFAELKPEILVMAAEPNGQSVKLPRDDLQEVVRTASLAQTYEFPGEGVLGPERTISTVKIVAGKRLTGETLQRLRTAMFSSRSYEAAGALQKSCPFDPRVGFRFSDAGREAWWLVSATCRTAILVSRNDDWRRVRTLNLTSDAVNDFLQAAAK